MATHFSVVMHCFFSVQTVLTVLGQCAVTAVSDTCMFYVGNISQCMSLNKCQI
uniref:Uncharacterized protein n=1 Tax=Anguilla anguilla TaxID=7936 RepID=A0A0E9XFH8_ANGAN